MSREVISTEAAPRAIGPYSQAVRAAGLVFCSGQIPLDPSTGKLVTGPIADQTRQVMSNLKAVLEAAGSCLERVVKVTVFLRDMDDFPEMNEEYARWFKEDPPARAAVEVARLPKDVGIEVEAIALA